MLTVILAVTVPSFYVGMWMGVARWHYRWWYENNHDVQEDDKRMRSGLIGLIWPLTWLWLLVYGLTWLVGWAESTPSLKERKAAKVKAKHERLADLQKQIEDAEGYLKEATRHLEQIQR